jgi:hypothetical protein
LHTHERKEERKMVEQNPGMVQIGLSRRTAVSGMVAGAAVAATGLFGRSSGRTSAEEATPAAGQCVAMAPPADATGMGFASLLVGGIVRDMPSGPTEVRISWFTLAPGVVFQPVALPYPSFLYIETGESACPGGPGRIAYGPDGTIIAEMTEAGVHVCSTGTTWYVPANIPDGAGNEGTQLMSSIIVEFVPVEGGGTSAAGTS